MIFQLNLAAIAAQAAWQKAKPAILRDVFILPVLGFLEIIVLWWIVALANHELMPTPPEGDSMESLKPEFSLFSCVDNWLNWVNPRLRRGQNPRISNSPPYSF